MDLTRRSLLIGAAGLPLASRRTGDPFTLGVASGDPTADGIVLWTRLAPRPLADGGHGGMPDRDVDVEWQLAEDERFTRVVRSGTATARPSWAHSVHVEPAGLQPGREYFYRFRTGGHLSPTGRTRTAPAPGTAPDLAFGVVSCSNYEQGYFTAYRRLAEQQPDLVLHLGDYIYEYAPGGYRNSTGTIVRSHTAHHCQTLAQYRLRHAQYKTDPDLRALHALAPWIAVNDDHEVENDWAGVHPGTSGRPGFAQRKTAGYRAYYEHMPLRRSALPRGSVIRLYRRLAWGDLTTFHVLDTRQYRDDQACDDGLRADCAARLATGRTLVGSAQRAWLAAGLRASRTRWNLLAQQIFMAQHDYHLGPGREVVVDTWDGYTADRDRILGDVVASGARNPVVLTGDIHCHYASDLLVDFDDPDSRRVGVELVTTSVTSDGDGYDTPAARAIELAENPHIAYADQRRGFIAARLTATELRADFHTLPYVTRRHAPSTVTASFTVADGALRLSRAAAPARRAAPAAAAEAPHRP
ncbi:alkaline phosphatase D family protein [Actinoallomurus soli]|uniref:alkaline phosphatase D family protein n=1 Tax=Actinoallomurus soli TaxID=2952535 RepID=UPI002093C04F|nr:alkaline phosphatase D family protein [Actinoallomurus soli]MCO5970693.1 alkaline phosphatase D family protein [Actinoallomurus soli]